ncbi:MAG: TolB family protein [Planctomycetota bacterium]
MALNVKTGGTRTLLGDPKGGVRDPQMHYSGKKVLFSYRKGGQPYYHLYEINTDGSGLRQLTYGPFDDFEPAYLPDGGSVFCSSRVKCNVPCYYTRVAVLYRCDGDGSNIRRLSANVEHENTPWVPPDGRVL